MNANKEKLKIYSARLYTIITELQALETDSEISHSIEGLTSYEQIVDDYASAKAHLARSYEEICKHARRDIDKLIDSNTIECSAGSSDYEDSIYGPPDKFLAQRIRKAQEGIY